MKCEAIRAIVNGSIGKGGPFAVTRAERQAVGAHYQSCEACRAFVDGMALESERQQPMTPLESTVLDLGMAILRAHDATDPEAQL